MEEIQWLFFDIGSTLADESEVYADIFRKIAESSGVSQEQVYRKAMEFYKQNMRGDREVARLLGVDFPEWNPQLEVLYDDAKECLKALSEQYRIGIIANQIPGTAERLKAFGIGDYISVIAASSDEGVAKPDKRLFEIALEKAGCASENAVMIGDRIDNDIVPAKSVGMKTVWIKQGPGQYWDIKKKMEVPDYEVNCLSEIPKAIADLSCKNEKNHLIDI